MDLPEDAEDSENSGPGRPLLLLDACCAINLLASGEARAILESLEGVDVAVVSLVAEREVLKVAATPEEEAAEAVGDEADHAGPERRETMLTLEPLIDRGLLTVLELEGEQEEATFVDLALELDDGEAMTGAIAIHRGGSVATDDKKAIRVLDAQRPALQIRRTSWLMRMWAQSADVGQERLRYALRDIELNGSFYPPPEDPLLDWWLRVTGRD